MFQVSGKYRFKFTGVVWTCVAYNGTCVTLVDEKTREARTNWPQEFSLYEPYHEPVKHVRYFNIYKNAVGANLKSHKEADFYAEPNRIGCQRVEFVEGTFDD